MENKYTGEVTIALGPGIYKLVYDWRAFGALQSEFGENFAAELTSRDPEKLAKMLVIGLYKYHPTVTEEFIFDLSPPIIEVAQAIDKAILYAYWGPQEAQRIMDDAKKVEKALEKKMK